MAGPPQQLRYEKLKIYDKLNLCISTNKFFLEPASVAPGVSGAQLLTVNRKTNAISLEPHLGQVPPNVIRKQCVGFMGIARLPACPYMIIATKKKKVGVVEGHEYFQLVQSELVAFLPVIPDFIRAENDKYVNMLAQILQTPYFYFSYSGDITHSLQRLEKLAGKEFQEKTLLERADNRFVFNMHFLNVFMQKPDSHKFLLPVIIGGVLINNCRIGEREFRWSIFSRRSRFRVGTRFFARGSDDEGRVANYVETEQIIECDNTVAAFVQTRGSMPFYWEQIPNIKYKPWAVLKAGYSQEDHDRALQRHFDEQMEYYGDQVILNLIDWKKDEGEMEKHFSKTVENQETDRIRYEAFDFHAECSKMRWHRLSILINRVKDKFDAFKYFYRSSDGTVTDRQQGLFRTNCMDCLDRTNVVQSLVATENLQVVFTRMNILKVGEKFQDHSEFMKIFRNSWADHADLISVQYAGTGALKTDYTRTGKRTKWGLLQDGWNAMVRYQKNNFKDGHRQDAYDFFAGNFNAFEPAVSNNPSNPSVVYLPFGMVASLLIMAFILITAQSLSKSMMVVTAICVVVFTVCAQSIRAHGPDFVDYPREIRKKRLGGY